MNGLRIGIAAGLVLCLLALASCGGDESTTSAGGQGETSVAAESTPAPVVAKANLYCVRMLQAVSVVGRRAQEAGYESARELTMKGLAEPGMKLIKELARNQQALQEEADSASFDVYAASFDPIIVLGEQWLQAQRKLDFERADRLEELLTDRGAEQQVLAQRAGLAKCSVDFLDAMVRSATS
ncbi:MAG TPA: hypothetical protein VK480_03570 [Solirubrobacterales bacterium]|nr:hypothetical protein [Solirubrobacterales bacterium]